MKASSRVELEVGKDMEFPPMSQDMYRIDLYWIRNGLEVRDFGRRAAYVVYR